MIAEFKFAGEIIQEFVSRHCRQGMATPLVETGVASDIHFQLQTQKIIFQAWDAGKYMIDRHPADFVRFNANFPAQRAAMMVFF
jgi:hypothetical protein